MQNFILIINALPRPLPLSSSTTTVIINFDTNDHLHTHSTPSLNRFLPSYLPFYYLRANYPLLLSFPLYHTISTNHKHEQLHARTPSHTFRPPPDTMLWSLFAREFSQQARNIAQTVSNPNLGGGSARSDPRRPSMRLAIKDVTISTSDTSKQERMDALLTKMKVIYAIDVLLYLVTVAVVIKALVTNETYFGSDQGVIMRLLLFILGMGVGVTLETLALYIHYKELFGMELTDAQKAVSERVFDVSSTGTRQPNLKH